MSPRLTALAPVAAMIAAVPFAAARPRPQQQAEHFSAAMNGGAETPATTVKGTGVATFTLDGNRLTYVVEVHDLSGPPTMAHIHVGAVGKSGPPVFTFPLEHKVATGNIAQGTIDLSKPVSTGVSGDSLKALLADGNAYVNVHTAAHPGGEIRGQIEKK